MGKINTFIRLLKNDRKGIRKALVMNISQSRLSRLIPDKAYIKMQYRANVGRRPDLKNPKTFNEKLQWLKLYNRDPRYCTMVDKYDVREYVAQAIGKEYLIPCLGLWSSVDGIEYDNLPDRFVLKCTHDSGSVIICDKEKLNEIQIKSKLGEKLKTNMFWWGREWPYKNLTPRIIAEQYMKDESGELRDYKLMCFNGRVRCTFVCTDRFSEKGLHVTFFDENWKVMPFERSFPSVKEGLPKPINYEKMVELAEKLSSGIPFVRVDFYEVNGQIYFGELTFYPGNGMEAFQPEEWDYNLGEWIDLPKKH